MPVEIKNETLSIWILEVKDADSIVIQLPVNEAGVREHILIDSGNSEKTIQCLRTLQVQTLKIVVLTHPHSDHYCGLRPVLRYCQNNNITVEQFWDSGFRSNKDTWKCLIKYLTGRRDIQFLSPTSGMTTSLAGVKITVLAPSIYLKNRYDSYGVDKNNGSIVLQLEYNTNKIILAGDAEWDSWAKITEEFPYYEKTDNVDSLIKVEKKLNPLKSKVLKVAHHGSKHGTSLRGLERLYPRYAIISCGAFDSGKHHFPDGLAVDMLNDEFLPRNTEVLTTNDNGTIRVHFHKHKKTIEIEPKPYKVYQKP